MTNYQPTVIVVWWQIFILMLNHVENTSTDVATCDVVRFFSIYECRWVDSDGCRMRRKRRKRRRERMLLKAIIVIKLDLLIMFLDVPAISVNCGNVSIPWSLVLDLGGVPWLGVVIFFIYFFEILLTSAVDIWQTQNRYWSVEVSQWCTPIWYNDNGISSKYGMYDFRLFFTRLRSTRLPSILCTFYNKTSPIRNFRQ